MSTFSEHVRRRRDELNLSQMQLAQQLGVSQGTISAWEKGAKTPAFPDRILLNIDTLDDNNRATVAAIPLPDVLDSTTRDFDIQALFPRSEKGLDARLPQAGDKIFGQVRAYLEHNAKALHTDGIRRGLDVWLLGPATLPITQTQEPQSIESLKLWVELITEHRAQYHVLWDLERMSLLPSNSLGHTDLGPEITGGQLYDAFDRLERMLAKAQSSNADGMPKEEYAGDPIHHIPIIRPPTTAGGPEDDRRIQMAERYWAGLQSRVQQLGWRFHSVENFPDMSKLTAKQELTAHQLMSIWSDGSSVILYQPKISGESSLADLAPDPIANMRFTDLSDHWNRNVANTYAPFAWLSTKRALKIGRLCEAWAGICSGAADDSDEVA